MRRATENEYRLALQRLVELSDRIAHQEEGIRKLKQDRIPTARAQRLLDLLYQSRKAIQTQMDLLSRDTNLILRDRNDLVVDVIHGAIRDDARKSERECRERSRSKRQT
jgi:uncharacterized coiled-coil protein SlyX